MTVQDLLNEDIPPEVLELAVSLGKGLYLGAVLYGALLAVAAVVGVGCVLFYGVGRVREGRRRKRLRVDWNRDRVANRIMGDHL